MSYDFYVPENWLCLYKKHVDPKSEFFDFIVFPKADRTNLFDGRTTQSRFF